MLWCDVIEFLKYALLELMGVIKGVTRNVSRTNPSSWELKKIPTATRRPRLSSRSMNNSQPTSTHTATLLSTSLLLRAAPLTGVEAQHLPDEVYGQRVGVLREEGLEARRGEVFQLRDLRSVTRCVDVSASV